jgi:hypothetical protein
MRVGSSTWYSLLADHLGGTNVTVTTAGVEFGEVRYKAFGDQRYSSGTTPTSFRYTGQRQEAAPEVLAGMMGYGWPEGCWVDGVMEAWQFRAGRDLE